MGDSEVNVSPGRCHKEVLSSMEHNAAMMSPPSPWLLIWHPWHAPKHESNAVIKPYILYICECLIWHGYLSLCTHINTWKSCLPCSDLLCEILYAWLLCYVFGPSTWNYWPQDAEKDWSLTPDIIISVFGPELVTLPSDWADWAIWCLLVGSSRWTKWTLTISSVSSHSKTMRSSCSNSNVDQKLI